jgi:hypothetical protein
MFGAAVEKRNDEQQDYYEGQKPALARHGVLLTELKVQWHFHRTVGIVDLRMKGRKGNAR